MRFRDLSRLLLDNAKLMRSQWLSQSDLQRRQLEAISSLLTVAMENSSFYRALYSDVFPRAPAVSNLSEVAELPIVDKSTLRQAGMEAVTVSLDQVGKLNRIATSGSTGLPFEVYFFLQRIYSLAEGIIHSVLS